MFKHKSDFMLLYLMAESQGNIITVKSQFNVYATIIY